MLFDVNAALGRFRGSRGGFDTPDELEREMTRLDIDEALVYHVLAGEGDVRLGNRLLSESIQGHPRLHACWTMAPPVLGDLPPASEWVAEAVAAGARAIRLFPRYSLYTPACWTLAPLLDAIEHAGLPVFFDFGAHHWSERVIPWDALEDLCLCHPDLAVVVTSITIGETRDAISLLHRLPNLHVELHAFNLPDGLALLASEGLAPKLLFGTGLPWRASECVVEQTLRSGLAPADLESVADGNARRLLGLAPRCAAPARPAPRTAGLVLDVHAHTGAWERTCTSVRGPEAVIRSMHRCGVHKMVVSSFAAIHGEMRAGNEEAAAAARACPGQLYAYAAINPHYPEEIEAELARCFEGNADFVGLKLHCGLHEVQLQHPGYERALQFAGENELPVLVHGGGQDDWAGVAQRYPRAAFIMAHACVWNGYDEAGRALYRPAGEIDNLYVDVAGSAAHRDALVALTALVGIKKVLFGSDFPMFDLAFETGRITSSKLAPAEKVMVCGGNALRIFKRIPHIE